MQEIEFILYVANQQKSKEFYSKLLNLSPIIDVPGMTDFMLSEGVKLGLMPEKGIVKILEDKVPNPEKGNGIPRCELYLKVNNAQEYFNRGLHLGGKLISEMSPRNWGDVAGYLADPDGHVIAFAEK